MQILSLDQIVRWLHLLAAVTWAGGLIYTHFVLTPPATGRGIPPAFIRLMCMGRFKWFAAGSLALLVVTGIYSALGKLTSLSSLIATPWGATLLIKLVFVAIALFVTAFTGFFLGPAITANAPKPGPNQPGPSAALLKFEKYLVLLSQVNLACALVILYFGVVLR